MNVENQEVNVNRALAILRMSFCVSCMGGTGGRYRKAQLTESGVERGGEESGVGRGKRRSGAGQKAGWDGTERHGWGREGNGVRE